MKMKFLPNDKCFCGSEKKYKNCCSPMKPRINLRTLNLTSEKFNKFSIDNKLNVELFIDGINNTTKIIDFSSKEIIAEAEKYVTNGYFGENRFKNIFQIPDEIYKEESFGLEVFNKFDSVIAIDTNKLQSNSQEFYLGAAFQFKFVPENEFPIDSYLIKLLQLEQNTEKPENCNWKNLIEFIVHHKQFNEKTRIALIVDSDLRDIPDYNKRTKPIYREFILPENFTLIYATSDKKESIINIMIRLCDTFLKKLAKELKT